MEYLSFILFIFVEVGTATDLKKPTNSLRSTEISSDVHLTWIVEENTCHQTKHVKPIKPNSHVLLFVVA